MACYSFANANLCVYEHIDVLVRASSDFALINVRVNPNLDHAKNRPDKGADPSRVKEALRSNREEVKVRL